MDNRTIAISANNLTKRFDQFTAVDEINFEVKRGEIFGFLGPNGSGKTTTIRMMLGLLKPTAGDIRVLDISMTKNPGAIRSRVGYMSQRFTLYNDLTVLQNLNFYGAAYGLENNLLKERIKSALLMSGLDGRGKTRTADLSGGWRQRLALSAAILHRPEVVFLDEPTAGVDPVSRREFWDLLYQLIEEGITIFVTTHYMDEAEHCHRLAFIQNGQLIARGTPEEIKAEIMDGQILEIAPLETIKAIAVLKSSRDAGQLNVGEIAMYGALIHVTIPVNGNGKVRRYMKEIKSILRAAGVEPGKMAAIEPSLEDVFIASMR
ncbi:MAG: ABC transporter ATP-binding protein [Anaerolineaceae bacterium]|nr:ABC transporter ATP-binding protein [Anaerolineaceae bacterium]